MPYYYRKLIDVNDHHHLPSEPVKLPFVHAHIIEANQVLNTFTDDKFKKFPLPCTDEELPLNLQEKLIDKWNNASRIFIYWLDQQQPSL